MSATDHRSSRMPNWAKPKAQRSFVDLTPLTIALVLFGFPMSALLSAMFQSPLGFGDNTLSIAVRVLTFFTALILFIKRTLSQRGTWPHPALLTLCVIYSIRLLYDSYFADNPAAANALTFFAVVTLVPALALSCTKPEDWNEDSAMLVLLAAGTLFVFLATWMLATGRGQEWIDQEIVALNGSRQSFERLNPISLGHAAVTVLLVCVSWLTKTSNKAFQFALAIIALTAIYLTYEAASRGPILALLAGLAFVLFSSKRGMVIATTGIIGLVLMSVFSYIDWASLLTQLRFSQAGADNNSLARIDYIYEGWDAFLASPVIGSNFEMPITGGWPHNIFIEILMSMGLIGMGVFLWALVPALLQSFRAANAGRHVGGILLIQPLVGAQFSGSLWGTTGIWIALAILLGGSRLGRTNRMPTQNNHYLRPNLAANKHHGPQR